MTCQDEQPDFRAKSSVEREGKDVRGRITWTKKWGTRTARRTRTARTETRRL